MKVVNLFAPISVAMFLLLGSGCMFAPQSQLASVQSQNRILTEQCQTQLAEIENLKTHARDTEDQLILAEEDLALMEDQVGMDRKQLANYQNERAELHEQFKGLASGQVRMPEKVSRQLAALSERHPGLRFDPSSGIGRLQTEILFDSGYAELKPGAEAVLSELIDVLNSPEAADLKVMVVGHTDDRRIAKKPAREKFPTNFHLSTARSLAVADALRKSGLAEQRLGVAGFGPHQPIAPNVTPSDRRKNRRVEIFVLNRDVPVVGWTESIPNLY